MCSNCIYTNGNYGEISTNYAYQILDFRWLPTIILMCCSIRIRYHDTPTMGRLRRLQQSCRVIGRKRTSICGKGNCRFYGGLNKVLISHYHIYLTRLCFPLAFPLSTPLRRFHHASTTVDQERSGGKEVPQRTREHACWSCKKEESSWPSTQRR
jgi:hypothetical protein